MESINENIQINEIKINFGDLMVQCDNIENNLTLTENGALTYKSSLDNMVDLYYRAMRDTDKEEIKRLMGECYNEDVLLTAKMTAYVRDVRGGKGERELGRVMLEKLLELNNGLVEKNMKNYIKEYGRWDDGIVFMNTLLENSYLDLLIKQFEEDIKNMNENKSISLCAKWFPSEGKALDKKYKINKKITKRMKISSEHFRKNILIPLRKYLDIVETHMMKKEYEKIDYKSVPSRCMNIHGKIGVKKKEPNAFIRNDNERFEQYKESLKKGETEIKVQGLFPHEITKYYYSNCFLNKDIDEITEGQWKAMRERTESQGLLGRTLAMCDVSGSMSGTPMLISLSLGILIAETVKHEGFRDLVLTFSESPEFHKIEGTSLRDRLQNLSGASWGMNTNLNKAFRKILERAIQFKIPEEDMPERLIIISDMQFDSAVCRSMTNFQEIDKLYEKSGYKRPQIVFWNVNGRYSSTPVTQDTNNTALVSGFSIDILKSVLVNKFMTPKEIMLNSLNDSRYDLITL